MAKQVINRGTAANDGTGESPFTGMGKVNDNFTELYDKNVAQDSLINGKAPVNNPVFTGTVQGVSKAHVGLGNVDNTADANKPVSRPQALGAAVTGIVYSADGITSYVQDSVTYSITYLNGRVSTLSDGTTTRTATYNTDGTLASYA